MPSPPRTPARRGAAARPVLQLARHPQPRGRRLRGLRRERRPRARRRRRTTSPSCAPRTPTRPTTRSSTACASSATAASSASTRRRSCASCCAGVGPFDVVVDVQNGIPFASTWAGRTPVVVLVHHVHREQWPVVYGPVRSRIGWWLESRLAPRVYRGSPLRRRLATPPAASSSRSGVARRPTSPSCTTACERPLLDPAPDRPTRRILVLGPAGPPQAGRARARPRPPSCAASTPTLRVARRRRRLVVAAAAPRRPQRLGVERPRRVHRLRRRAAPSTRSSARAWVLALPSLKEGWGLVVMEAAGYAVPTVGYARGRRRRRVRRRRRHRAARRRRGRVHRGPAPAARRRRAAPIARHGRRGAHLGVRLGHRRPQSFARVLARAAGRPETAAVEEVEPAHVHHEPEPPSRRHRSGDDDGRHPAGVTATVDGSGQLLP